MISHTEIDQLHREPPATRTDIKTIQIDPTQPIAQRISAFLGEVKNPYHFCYGDTPVSISFAENGQPLETILIEHFARLKR